MINVLLFAMPDSILGFEMATIVPNLALVSLAGNVDPVVCDVKVVDLILFRRNTKQVVLDLLRKQSPKLVGLSCMSFQYNSAVEIAKLVKSYDKNILVAIGGYHPTLMSDEISKSPESQYIDFIIRGEGEATFGELVNAINADTGYDKIMGLSYKVNNSFNHNPPRNLLSMSKIQLPKRDARLLNKGFHSFGLPLDVIETSRGCTFGCKFCSINHMYGRSFRKYETDRIINDIKSAVALDAKAIAMADDNITLDLKKLEEICDAIIDTKLNWVQYSIQASVKGIAHSERLVQKMADTGIKLVFLGIESINKKNLDFLGKNTTCEETVKAVKYLKDNGIICAGGFIIGNPDDDEESLWDVFKTARELKVDIPIFFILTPHAKTEIREELLAEGLVTNPDDFSTYNGFVANVRTKHLTPKQIDDIAYEMYGKYHSSLDYVKFTQVRKSYPGYFWRLAAKTIALSLPRRLGLLRKV